MSRDQGLEQGSLSADSPWASASPRGSYSPSIKHEADRAPGNFPSARNNRVFCPVNEEAWSTPEGGGWSPGDPTWWWVRGWGFSVSALPTPSLTPRAERLEWRSDGSPVATEVVTQAQVTESRPQSTCWGASRLGSGSRGRTGVPPPHAPPSASVPGAAAERTRACKPAVWRVGRFSSSVSPAGKFTEPRRGSWEPLTCNRRSEAQGTKGTCAWLLKVGGRFVGLGP